MVRIRQKRAEELKEAWVHWPRKGKSQERVGDVLSYQKQNKMKRTSTRQTSCKCNIRDYSITSEGKKTLEKGESLDFLTSLLQLLIIY